MTEKALKELLQLLSQKGEPVKPFEMRSYSKSELAMLYFPDAKLRELNSPPRAHRYTRREVELIVEYLCEP